ncbi:hypothetical protein TWF730_010684 [Orbilia blumenaviensis]|uniref:Uncharacterized protein n=1 Tax=Orbilia blumenaviensis TaxID=1796055 RepID=A0AAV9UNZ3_9PEZI
MSRPHNLSSLISDFQSLPISLPREKLLELTSAALKEHVNAKTQAAAQAFEAVRLEQHKSLVAQGLTTAAFQEVPIPTSFFPDHLFTENLESNQGDIAKWGKTLSSHVETKFGQHLEACPEDKPHPESLAAVSPGIIEEFLALARAAMRYGMSEEAVTLMFQRLRAYAARYALLISQGEIVAAGPILAAIGEIIAVVVAAVAIVDLFFNVIYPSLLNAFSARARAEHQQAERRLQDEIEKAQQEQQEADNLIDELNRKQDRKKKQREKDKKKREEEEKEKEKRKDYYYGVVERIDRVKKRKVKPHESGDPSVNDVEEGFELRISAIKENTVADKLFAFIGSHSVLGTDLLAISKHDILAFSIYLDNIGGGIVEDAWVNFKSDLSDKQPATRDYDEYFNGFCYVEEHKPKLLLGTQSRGIFGHFADSTWGYKGTVDTGSFKTDLPATAAEMLQHIFDGLNTSENQMMRCAQLATAELPGVSDNYKDPQLNSISTILFGTPNAKPRAQSMIMGDIGQAAWNTVLGMKTNSIFEKPSVLFVSDYGYGKGIADLEERIEDLIHFHPDVPLILSHWDSDHYRLATSHAAKDLHDSNWSPDNRPWIAPKLKTGIVAQSLAGRIGRRKQLYEWTFDNDSYMSRGNITIARCNPVHAGKPNDKNNNGALAILMGTDDDGYVLYPGDANFEAIPFLADIDGKVKAVVATHHGSTRSLDNSHGTGSQIPHAVGQCQLVVRGPDGQFKYFGNEPVTLFSYGRGNSYGHSVHAVGKFYESKGYKKFFATEELTGSTGAHTDAQVGITLVFDPDASGNPKKLSEEEMTLFSTRRNMKFGEEKDAFVRKVVLPPAYAEEIRLGPEANGLDTYAIPDGLGNVEQYFIMGSKVIIDAPLKVRCTADYPLRLTIQCHDIVINLPSPTTPLVTFDVADGFAWTGPAEAEQIGRVGNDAAMGGFLDLRVGENWIITSNGGVVFDSTQPSASSAQNLKIEYINGKGGNGQQGGRGRNGANGESSKDYLGQSGGDGFDGAQGGEPGRPTGYRASLIVATKPKVKHDSDGSKEITFSTIHTNYGLPGDPGQGGEGGKGGKGGVNGVWYNGMKMDDRSNQRQPDGFKGFEGMAGIKIDIPAVPVQAPQITLYNTVQETENNILKLKD